MKLTTTMLCGLTLLLVAAPHSALANNSSAVLTEYQRLAGVSEKEAKQHVELVTLAIKNELRLGVM